MPTSISAGIGDSPLIAVPVVFDNLILIVFSLALY